MKNRFARNSGVYTCEECGKRTRDTGYGEGDLGLCAKCYRKGEYYNSLQDGEITEEEYNDICEKIDLGWVEGQPDPRK